MPYSFFKFCFTASYRGRIYPIIFMLAFFSFSLPADAQIVNVQTRFSELACDGWNAGFGFSADWREGNVSLLLLGSQASLQYGRGGNQIMLSLNGELTVTEALSDTMRLFEHLRYRYWFIERLALESFLQHEYDPGRRYRVRLLAGIGPRYVPVHDKNKSLALGVALMGERIELSAGDQADSGRQDNFLRISSYIIGRISTDTFSISQSFYIQPRLDALDYRMLGETSIAIPLTDYLSLSFAFTAARLSNPPEDVKPLDIRLLSSLTVTLK